eukprot:70552-Rhodomonas_salina.6
MVIPDSPTRDTRAPRSRQTHTLTLGSESARCELSRQPSGNCLQSPPPTRPTALASRRHTLLQRSRPGAETSSLRLACSLSGLRRSRAPSQPRPRSYPRVSVHPAVFPCRAGIPSLEVTSVSSEKACSRSGITCFSPGIACVRSEIPCVRSGDSELWFEVDELGGPREYLARLPEV